MRQIPPFGRSTAATVTCVFVWLRTCGAEVLNDGRVLIYRRGYSSEEQEGRLLLEKLDYLQEQASEHGRPASAVPVAAGNAWAFTAIRGVGGRLSTGRPRRRATWRCG